jgi:DNA-binding transcriptional ArsR family regulator
MKFLDGYISIIAYKGMSPFEAIAEPNRRHILDLLRAGERPAGDLVAATGLSQPGVSKHLKLLREAGLVSVRPDGQRRLYRLEPGELAELDAWLKPFRTFWADRLDALEDHLEKEQ